MLNVCPITPEKKAMPISKQNNASCISKQRNVKKNRGH